MARYKVYGKCMVHYYAFVEANSEDEAWDIAESGDLDFDWERDEEHDQLIPSWEVYDVEEV